MVSRLKVAVTTLLLLLVFGTVIYHMAEGWTWIDSFYFTSVTLSTIGYGDIHSTTPGTRLFTAFFALSGVGIALYTLSLIGGDYVERREKALMERMNQESDRKSESIASKILKADQHFMAADKHVMTLLEKIDARIKK